LRTTPPLGPERAIVNGEVKFPLDYFSGGRSIVTTDKGFNEKAFKICEHPGIIIINTRSKHRAAATFKNFLLSGHRKHAEEAVTYINETNIRVKKHNNKVVDFPLS
jgi:hypothetical protein